MYRNVILPASLLAGTIIGAGAFALPFVFVKAGIVAGLFYLIIFGAILTLLHLMYADIIVRTPENFRFAGYAKKYFGSKGFGLAMLTSLGGEIFILTVYLILSVSFIKLVAPQLSAEYSLIIFWILGSLAIFLNVNRLAISEFLITLGITFIILIIFLKGLMTPLKLSIVNFNYIFLPYGAVLFALIGRTAVPTVLGYFRNNNQPPIMAKIPIILGTLLSAFIYFLFALGVIRLSPAVSEDAISGLVGQLSPSLLLLLGILGIISLWSSYIVIGRDVKKSLEHDLSWPQIISGAVVLILPILLYFFGFQNFLKLVSAIGGIFIGLESILIVLMWRKASRAETGGGILPRISPLVIYLLLLVFFGGLIYEILYNLPA